MPPSPFKKVGKKFANGSEIHVEDLPAGTEMENDLQGEAAAPSTRKSSLISGSQEAESSLSKSCRVEVPPLPKAASAALAQGQVDMNMLSKQMSELSLNMNSKFDIVQTSVDNLNKQLAEQAATFKEELAKLRVEMVSRVEFEAFEKRVQKLETGGLASAQVAALQKQVERLDPANKSLSFVGWKDVSGEARVAKIQEFLNKIGSDQGVQRIEHVWSGTPGSRKMTGISIVEFSSRDCRESRAP